MSLLIKDEAPEKLIDEKGKRVDGRDLKELRPIKMEVGIVPNAAGSAYIEWGGNKIYAAVYGPREVHPHHMARPDRGILRAFYRMATFSVHERKRAAPGRREKEISMVMENALSPVLFLELYPDSALELFVEVISADGGTRCASITVAALALADAGIPMRSLVSAVAGGKADGKLILDCSGDEDKAGEADLPVAITWFNNEISLLQFDGIMSLEEFEETIESVKESLEKIHEMQKEALKRKYIDIRNDIKENESEEQHEGGDQET
jgi:exosome complex component RRP41